MDAIRKTSRTSNCFCCVVGCRNRYSNTPENIKFYAFPGRPYQKDRRKVWINSIRRKSSTGGPWEPKKGDKVCSAHFVGNEKSHDQSSPSYNPTIFPKEYKITSQASVKTKIERYERSKKRRETKSKCTAEFTFVDCSNFEKHIQNGITTPVEPSSSMDFSSQDSLFDESEHTEENNCFLFECDYKKISNDVATQANVTKNHSFK